MASAENINLSDFKQAALTLWASDRDLFAKSQDSAKVLGEALNKVADLMPHGAYKHWLKANGIDRNRATYCMRKAAGKVNASNKKLTANRPDLLGELRAWIKQACPAIAKQVCIQSSAYGIVERSTNKETVPVFDLELRSISFEQIKAVCEEMQRVSVASLVLEDVEDAPEEVTPFLLKCAGEGCDVMCETTFCGSCPGSLEAESLAERNRARAADDGVSIVFETDVLKSALAKLKVVSGASSQEAIYKRIRIFTDAAGVNLQGIDCDKTMTLKIPSLVRCDTDRLVGYAELRAMIERLTTKLVSMSFAENNSVSVTSGQFKASLPTFQSGTFTELPIVAGIAEKPAFGGYVFGLPGLRDQIKAVEFAVPASDARHGVTSALIAATATELSLIGTDGIVLTMSTTPSALGEFSFTMPKPALEIIKKLEGGKDVTISETEGTFFFETETELVTYNKMHAEFPPYQARLPKPGDAATVVTFKEKARLIAALERLKLGSDEKAAPVNMSFDGELLNLVATRKETNATNDGSFFREVARDSMPVEGTGPAFKVRLGAPLLLPFLKRAIFPVTMAVKDQTSIVDFRDSGSLRHLLMPRRDNEIRNEVVATDCAAKPKKNTAEGATA